VNKLVKEVGQLIELPKETPTVATITDENKLKDQAFFANAKNGDKVLIFTNSKKAILYRPSLKKIIEVAPINLGQSQTQTVKVAIYNGTKTVGLTKTAGADLKSKVSNADVITSGNASNDYSKTIVVDLTGGKKADADNIAKILNGEVGSLPQGETKPNADILVILGSNYIK